MGKIIQLYLYSTDHIFVFDSSIYAGSCSTSILECSVFCGCVDLWCCAYPSGFSSSWSYGVMPYYKHSWFATDANPRTSIFSYLILQLLLTICSTVVQVFFMQLERYILQVYHEAMNSIYLALDFLFHAAVSLLAARLQHQVSKVVQIMELPVKLLE